MGGEGFFQSLAGRDAITEEASPFPGNFFIEAIKDEDEGSLEWCDDCEQNQEDGDDHIIWNQEHEVSKHP